MGLQFKLFGNFAFCIKTFVIYFIIVVWLGSRVTNIGYCINAHFNGLIFVDHDVIMRIPGHFGFSRRLAKPGYRYVAAIIHRNCITCTSGN